MSSSEIDNTIIKQLADYFAKKQAMLLKIKHVNNCFQIFVFIGKKTLCMLSKIDCKHSSIMIRRFFR